MSMVRAKNWAKGPNPIIPIFKPDEDEDAIRERERERDFPTMGGKIRDLLFMRSVFF